MVKKAIMGASVLAAGALPVFADGPTAPDITGIVAPLVAGAAACVTVGIGALCIPWGIRYFKGLLRRFLG